MIVIGLAWAGVAWAGAPARIAALGVDVEETIVALGHGDRVVAVLDGAEGLDHAARVGVHRRIGTEAVLATAPDLVVAGGQAGPPEVLDALVGTGIAVTRLPETTDLDGVRAMLRSVAAAVGDAPGGDRLVAKLDADLASAPKVPSSTRVAFVYARGAGTMLLAGQGTGAHAAITATGATPVATWDGYRPITDEALVAAKPDVILLTTGGLASVGGEAGLRALPAVSLLGDGVRVVSMDDRLLLSMGPRTGTAVATLAGLLEAPR